MVTSILDYPIVPPIRVKHGPHPLKLESIADALALANEAFSLQPSPLWRELKAKLDCAQSEEDAIEAIDCLREILMLRGLLD